MTDSRAERRGRRLLVLTPFPPRLDASHGGSRVTAQLLARLSDRHRVGLLCLKAPEEPGVDEALLETCELVEEVARRVVHKSLRRAWIERRRLVLRLQGASPFVASRFVDAFGPRVRAVVAAWEPEVVQVEHLAMAQYLPRLGFARAARILVEHDPPGAPVGPPNRELLRWRRLEQEALGRVDAAVVFTERDRRTLQALSSAARIVRIPLGAEVPARPADPLGDGATLLFVGSFVHPPNVEAARRLARSILPLVRRRDPEARLVLVGEAPPPPVRNLASEHVTVTGRVDDLRPYVDRAAVVVAPLGLGGGMRVKVLDALAAGKALVASSLALEGLALVAGVHAVVADDDEAMAAAITDLLDDPARRSGLAANARVWALANLGWDGVVDAYEELYASLGTAGGDERPMPRRTAGSAS